MSFASAAVALISQTHSVLLADHSWCECPCAEKLSTNGVFLPWPYQIDIILMCVMYKWLLMVTSSQEMITVALGATEHSSAFCSGARSSRGFHILSFES